MESLQSRPVTGHEHNSHFHSPAPLDGASLTGLCNHQPPLCLPLSSRLESQLGSGSGAGGTSHQRLCPQLHRVSVIPEALPPALRGWTSGPERAREAGLSPERVGPGVQVPGLWARGPSKHCGVRSWANVLCKIGTPAPPPWTRQTHGEDGTCARSGLPRDGRREALEARGTVAVVSACSLPTCRPKPTIPAHGAETAV